METQSQAYYNI